MAGRFDRHSVISQRSMTILNMVTNKSNSATNINQEIDINTASVKNREKSPESALRDDINQLYARTYSMTSSLFETFCETQVTYNSHHKSNLENMCRILKESFPEHQTADISNLQGCNSPNPLDFTCYEVMSPDEEISVCHDIENVSKLPPDIQCDYDSDDSVRDKDYCPSDNSSSEGSYDDLQAPRIKMLKPQIYRKKKVSNSISSRAVSQAKVTRTAIVRVNENRNNLPLQRRRSTDFGNSEKSAPPCRKRRNTIDAVVCGANQTLSTYDTEPIQLPSKRKKYDTPLSQRKNDAKNNRILKFNVKTGCDERYIKKCSSKMNQEDREGINKAYWNMSWSERHAFVSAHYSIAIPKRKITTEPKRQPKRAFTLKNLDGTRIDVCKTFFLTTLGYKKTNDRVLHNTFTDPTIDKRGKHQKTPAFDRGKLTGHVESFNPLEPHYRREHAPRRRYLPSDLNIVHMHRDFCEKYPNETISYSLYRQHVKQMNISFTRLGNEECEMCEAYDLHKKQLSHDCTSQIIADCSVCLEWAKHHDRYSKARMLYNKHKNMPKSTSEIFFSADLEKVIMLPRLDTFKTAIFCQRLVAFNQTFAPVGKITTQSKPLTVIWHDGIAGRKQEDIMSAFYHFLMYNRDVTNIHLWLDNCSAQNKNWLLYFMIIHIINSELISTQQITFYYFEPGHTFMSSDQVHRQVELAMKKKANSTISVTLKVQ